MSCHENSCDTTKGDCNEGHKKGDDCCTLAEDLICLAKCAKEELLRDKIKKALDAKIGKKLDNVANIVADAANACLQHELESKQACADYKENLLAALKG